MNNLEWLHPIDLAERITGKVFIAAVLRGDAAKASRATMLRTIAQDRQAVRAATDPEHKRQYRVFVSSGLQICRNLRQIQRRESSKQASK